MNRKLTWLGGFAAPLGRAGALMALSVGGREMACENLPESGQRVPLGRCGRTSFELANQDGYYYVVRRSR
jgi:hypothetical protein